MRRNEIIDRNGPVSISGPSDSGVMIHFYLSIYSSNPYLWYLIWTVSESWSSAHWRLKLATGANRGRHTGGETEIVHGNERSGWKRKKIEPNCIWCNRARLTHLARVRHSCNVDRSSTQFLGQRYGVGARSTFACTRKCCIGMIRLSF